MRLKRANKNLGNYQSAKFQWLNAFYETFWVNERHKRKNFELGSRSSYRKVTMYFTINYQYMAFEPKLEPVLNTVVKIAPTLNA